MSSGAFDATSITERYIWPVIIIMSAIIFSF